LSLPDENETLFNESEDQSNTIEDDGSSSDHQLQSTEPAPGVDKGGGEFVSL